MRKNMVRIGAIKSRFPISMAAQEIASVASSALTGSPLESSSLKMFSGGISSSLVIACRRRGALVSDCRAAPSVDSREPITMRNGNGQATKVTASCPFACFLGDWSRRLQLKMTMESREIEK